MGILPDLSGKGRDPAKRRKIQSLERGKNWRPKLWFGVLRRPKLTIVYSFACSRLFAVSKAGLKLVERLASCCAFNSVLWEKSAHLIHPGLNDVPGTLETAVMFKYWRYLHPQVSFVAILEERRSNVLYRNVHFYQRGRYGADAAIWKPRPSTTHLTRSSTSG